MSKMRADLTSYSHAATALRALGYHSALLCTRRGTPKYRKAAARRVRSTSASLVYCATATASNTPRNERNHSEVGLVERRCAFVLCTKSAQQ